MLALMVGATTVLAGVFRLGFVADLLSRPTQIGYMNGLALTILVGQLPKLFGFSVDADNLLGEMTGFVEQLVDGATLAPALMVGLGSLVVILVCQRLFPRVPGVLVAVILAIGAVSVFDLVGRGVDVVGPMPQGFPPFTLPHVPLDDLTILFAGALGISLVALTDTISTASVFAARRGEEVDGNREMIGIGAASIAAGLFQGFPVSTSGSRTAVAAQNGGKTQVTGLVGAAAIIAMLLLTPGLLADLPQPALAAVVIAASLSLADIASMRRLRRQRTSDFWLAVAAFLGVAFLGVLPGIAIAIGLSIANVFRRSWWPHQAVLGRVRGMPGYHDSAYHPTEHHLPGLVIYRFDAPLFFANARAFRDQVRHLAHSTPRPTWIVVAAEPVTDVDTTAADMLADLDAELDGLGVTLVFAELKDPVRRRIERYELTDAIETRHFFATVKEAVEAYREHTGNPWTPGPSPYTLRQHGGERR
jgi:high affinity sulfate transporter 1